MPFMVTLLGALALTSFVIALVLLAWSHLLLSRAGVPAYSRLEYCDPGAWSKLEDPLFSSRYGLSGKPDYVVRIQGSTQFRTSLAVWKTKGAFPHGESGGRVIPLEVRPNRSVSVPRESDVMQLAAYGLLVEQVWGIPPPYGLLKYRDAIFRVEFTSGLRARLLDLMAGMRHDLDARNVKCSHREPQRCQDCGYRDNCGQPRARKSAGSPPDPKGRSEPSAF
jgi:CRISPR-associated exonuclease Cas4